jgi:3-deoxy-D-arabino-heptulosonate 7-phosphate (DAHP) synthase
MTKDITIVAGPCAVESEEQIMGTAYKISQIRDIVKPYNINFKLRGGAWKPRTKYFVQNGTYKERVFEGEGELGLRWLAQAADEYDLPIVSELMSEMDLRYFLKHLKPERDYLQIGARNSQNFALLFHVGSTEFGVVLKNPQHGVNLKEAEGSIERLIKNREIVYCTRGQMKYIHPDGEDASDHKLYLRTLLDDSHQHPDARNLNNIKAIKTLKKHLDSKVKFCHDPSHTWGGNTHKMRGKIGAYAMDAIINHDYDWIMLEVNDKSKGAKCDAQQALVTTTNGIDWSQTYIEESPGQETWPFTLVDILVHILNSRGDPNVMPALDKLAEIRWDATPN